MPLKYLPVYFWIKKNKIDKSRRIIRIAGFCLAGENVKQVKVLSFFMPWQAVLAIWELLLPLFLKRKKKYYVWPWVRDNILTKGCIVTEKGQSQQPCSNVWYLTKRTDLSTLVAVFACGLVLCIAAGKSLSSVSYSASINAQTVSFRLLQLSYCVLNDFALSTPCTEEPVLKDHPIGKENVVCQDRWSLVTGSITLKC